LRGFEQRLTDFHDRGVEVVAISVDSPGESKKLCESRGYSFPFLSDPNAQVIRQYGVLHPKGGEDRKDIARPAEFLVDASGTVRWVNLTDDIRVRARPEVVLGAIARLGS
jgi:thioredoxin-dependent peroxiredoxin